MGLPRRVKPHRVIGMSDGNGDWEVSTSSGMKRRDLKRLRWRPTKGPSLSMIPSAVMRSFGEPTRAPSSKYHAFKERSGTYNGMEREGETQRAQRVTLLHLTAAEDGVLAQAE